MKFKRTIYIVILVIAAITLGRLIGSHADGELAWLAYNLAFSFTPGELLDIDILQLTFGISVNINVAQIILLLLALFVDYKTSSKLFPS